MLVKRSGMARSDVLGFTVPESVILCKEIEEADNHEQLRLAEAWHNPTGLIQRLKEQEGRANPNEAFKALMGRMVSKGFADPKKTEETRMYDATMRFLEAQRAGKQNRRKNRGDKRDWSGS